MKVSIEQVGKALKRLSDEPEKAKVLLRYWFSFYENIDTFSKFCFPKYILGSTPEFHKEIYEFLEVDEDGALAAPRGHAKSTCVGLVYVSWNIVNQLQEYIVYVSQNHAKTIQFVEPISYEFKHNERLKWLYGDLRLDKSTDEIGRDREDCVDINGCRVEAVSFEKNLRGFKYKNKRPTLIVADDIEDDARVMNPVLRDKDEKKLNNVIIPSLDINGKLKMIGTILHLDSLLSKKIKLYGGKIYQAEDSNGNILWSERFTRAKLDKIKRSIGSVAYQQEYLNNPVDNSTSIIQTQWVRQCYDNQYNYTYADMDKVYLGVDFAFADRIGADKSAFVDIGIKNNKKYLLNVIYKQGMSINEQIELIRHLHEQNNYETIVLEENSIKSVSKDITQMDLPIKMFWTGSRDSTSMEKSSSGKSYSKINAINRLSVEFENNMWVIPYVTDKQKDVADYFLSEVSSWALESGKLVELGVHPDSPIGVMLVNELLNGINYDANVLEDFAF